MVSTILPAMTRGHQPPCLLAWPFGVLFASLSLLSVAAAVTTPAAGWCKSKHQPRKPAQSGYDGYCKACFRERFPQRFAEKQQNRKQSCRVCGSHAELSGGTCRPCLRRRTCGKCERFDETAELPLCRHCKTLRLLCSECMSPEEQAQGLCTRCDKTHGGMRCAFCGKESSLSWREARCAVLHCATRNFRVCDACDMPVGRQAQMTCPDCWRLQEKPCLICGSLPAQKEKIYRRCCKSCVFPNPSFFFSKNDTPSTRKPRFLRSGGSQNGAKTTPKMEPKSSSGAGGLRESLRERFWRVLEGPRGSPEAPQERPRSAQERPRRPNMTPRRPNMSPRRPQMTPRRVKMSPRRAKVSSGRSREASGSDLERISEAFSSNAMRPRRSQLKPPARARSARARL